MILTVLPMGRVLKLLPVPKSLRARRLLREMDAIVRGLLDQMRQSAE